LLRSSGFQEDNIFEIRKPEDIPAILKEQNIPFPEKIFLETGQISHKEFLRQEAIFNPAKTGDATALFRKARMIKTPWEIGQFRISAEKHAAAYREIPSVFRKGMKDIEFQIEIERLMRRQGSLGIFRTFGENMDIFMGSLLTGDNAGNSSPYDFALGGLGMHPCLPIGANGEVIKKGTSVMVDMVGNFTAYMSDMTRVFSFGKLPDEAYRAHKLSMDMHNRLMEEVKPGVSCASVYEWSLKMVENAGFSAHFMGTKQQAKFVGHGVGIEINELPVLMNRSKDVFLPGMVFAFEPKFVLPEIGAVGNENTFLITDNGIEKLTIFDEEIRDLVL
ncbi:MAG: M24 family metallopeptidase, partial [Tannerella sp.]|jgi:Xaa-Pro aminopeptidase|nr:M24 family metallopeptidase [Tannerella sp.]